MAKKNKKQLEATPVAIVKDASGETVATIRMDEPRYQTVPVDMDTYRGILQLCAMRGMGQRSKGAMVRILVKSELEKVTAAVKLAA